MKTDPWPDPPDLETDEIHVWWARVGAAEGVGAPVGAAHGPDPRGPGGGAPADEGAWLNPDEEARAARFHFERHRTRYVARQRFLRWLLGRYTGEAPERLAFGSGRHGKPFLIPAPGPASGAATGSGGATTGELTFNLSHSEHWILVGVSRGRELGVDVEVHRLRTELDRMAQAVFTPRECTTLDGVERDLRLDAFFRGWTRKEAALKATGEGFAREPRTLEIGLGPRRAGECWDAPDDAVLVGYELADLDAPEGVGAAVCATAPPWRPRVVTPWRDAVIV